MGLIVIIAVINLGVGFAVAVLAQRRCQVLSATGSADAHLSTALAEPVTPVQASPPATAPENK
jgi:hypothetical protein